MPGIGTTWTNTLGMEFTVTNTACWPGYVWARRNDSPLGTEQRWPVSEWREQFTPKVKAAA